MTSLSSQKRPLFCFLSSLCLIGCIESPPGVVSPQEEMGRDMSLFNPSTDMGRQKEIRNVRFLNTDVVQLNGGACPAQVNADGCYVSRSQGASIIDSGTKTRCESMIRDIRIDNDCESEADKNAYLLAASQTHSGRVPPYLHGSLFFNEPFKSVNLSGGSIRMVAKVQVAQILPTFSELNGVQYNGPDLFRYGALCLTLHTDGVKGNKALGSTGRYWGIGSPRGTGSQSGDPTEAEFKMPSWTQFAMRPDGGPENETPAKGLQEVLSRSVCGGINFEVTGRRLSSPPSLVSLYYTSNAVVPDDLMARFTPLYSYTAVGAQAQANDAQPFFNSRRNTLFDVPERDTITLEFIVNSTSVTLNSIDGSDTTSLISLNQNELMNNSTSLKDRLQLIKGDVFVGLTASTSGQGLDILVEELNVTYTPPARPQQ